MKVTSWNCNGAFRKKFSFISELNSDIYIIQECENPVESKDIEYKSWAKNFLWVGDTKNKGLGVFAKEHIFLESLNWTSTYKDHSVKHFLPCIINNDFQLLAVWTHKNNSPNFGYIGQFWKYLQINKNKFKKIIVAGDFNSNTIWDEWDRWWNHSDVVRELEEIKIKSLYHTFYKEKHGEETIPTFYLQKNINKQYHIDYIFAEEKLSSQLQKIEIAPFEKWKHLSDHCPVTATFLID